MIWTRLDAPAKPKISAPVLVCNVKDQTTIIACRHPLPGGGWKWAKHDDPDDENWTFEDYEVWTPISLPEPVEETPPVKVTRMLGGTEQDPALAVIVAARRVVNCLHAPDPNQPHKLQVAPGQGLAFSRAGCELAAALVQLGALDEDDKGPPKD